MLGLAKQRGATGVALEVSAQAIARNRLDGVTATVAGFTNLSHDHFEDFGDMENYFQAKAQLFTPPMATAAVVCVDNIWGRTLAETTAIPVTTVGGPHASPVGEHPHWMYRVVDAGATESVFEMIGPSNRAVSVRAPIIGDHMVANAALAIVMLIESGVSAESIEELMGPSTPGIPVYLPGRIERVSGEQGPQVFVDAGRSEDAYRSTLQTVRDRTAGRVVMLCGTSGNRDATKRPLMGVAAAELADVVIVTDDDPRREDPAVIRSGLLDGARSVAGSVVHEVPDPSEAIRFAVSLVGEGDSVLWSGPGSQSYRDIGGEKVAYSARAEARLALREAGWPLPEESHE
jgi:UDP-N-acetylmuramoyl-L-alanyl-D-glutamate--2,6-diaminopimelate ligase